MTDQERIEAEIELEAIYLALNDCQMWDNLPQMARDFYLREAREEVERD